MGKARVIRTPAGKAKGSDGQIYEIIQCQRMALRTGPTGEEAEVLERRWLETAEGQQIHIYIGGQPRIAGTEISLTKIK